MNPSNPDNNSDSLPVSELAMMRLVDGELKSAERAELLKRLESQPGGWRDCALAFLEDQAWRQAMTEPRLPSVSRRTKTVSSADRSQAENSFWGTLPGFLSLAAALLLAFAVGKWSPSNHSGVTAPESHIAEQSPIAVEENGEPRQVPPHVAAAAGAKMFNEQGAPLMMMDQDFWKHDSSLPIGLQKQLESLGAKVKSERGLMPVRANDGREWIVPYEDVRVVPVMNVSM